MSPRRFTIADAEAMRVLGARLSDALRRGDLVILDGPLGAGKTTLVQGIAAGLGVRERVTSPTFVIARVHTTGRIPLVHVDAYRLGSLDEVDDLDLDMEIDEAITVVEWGSGKVEQLGADGYLTIALARGDDDVRTVAISATGDAWSGREVCGER